jgi:hypothetical protein
VNPGFHPRELSPAEPLGSAEMGRLFHRLNNQLGVVLAHAEMLEEKATDETQRQHAARVVASVLDALATSRQIRRLSDTDVL